VTLFWQSKMMTPKTPSSQEKRQDLQGILSQQMLYLFPLMTVFIALKFPSALALYWVITTLFGIIQQYLILRGDGGVKGLRGARGTIVTVKKRE
jgi:YidC/Oxa1 family membrane protein insertase